MASSSSSSSKRRRSYDVFLSFRGPDVRNYFLGHLYTALVQEGINTYMDREELGKGEQISPQLMEAIDESQIAIVVFSENYASSTWCLEELARIMDRKDQEVLMVFPVFYKVDPCEVRTPRESYREAMTKHEIKFGKDSEKVQQWKKALFDAGNLSGWHFTDRNEAGFIQDIVQDISTQLDRTPLDVAKHPVGLGSRVQELKTILNLQSKDDVLMVGLWGQGGVGKTTLAKAIYNAIFREFQGSSVLEHVRENSKNSKDLVSLQEKLLSEVLLGKKLTVYSVCGGSRLIQDRLCNKRVLIILDDVDDASQLNVLAGNCEWFGKGSRIIVTTRNKHLLTSHWEHWVHTYEVNALKDDEALELFRKHACLGNRKTEISCSLVDSVLHYASSLPLALVVLGSFLCGRSEREWESTLQKLAKIPDKQVNDVLKVSYDGLEDYAKEIFLDIACFFNGFSMDYIKKVLDSCDFDTTIGLQILIERCLIRETSYCLQMHDLIQSMGMDIVKQEWRDDPRKRSRLWLYEDVVDVLSENVGTNATKAIVLKLPEPQEMYIGANAFTNMRRLRLLILHNVDNSFQGLIHLPDELRWFEWPGCASIPDFSHGLKKLVGLDMRQSMNKVVGEQLKDFNKLKYINFRDCRWLVCTPDLSGAPNLEELSLYGCENLECVHESTVNHGKLRRLDLSRCSKLPRLPDIPNKIEGLRYLSLNMTSIEELPASIKNFVSLREMDLGFCEKLAVLPSSIYRLSNLEDLCIHHCSKLTKFPKEEDGKTGFPNLRHLDLWHSKLSEAEFLENRFNFPSLISLSLSGNNFTNLPMLEHLHELIRLDVADCQYLQEIPKIPRKLFNLWADNCESLSMLPSNICDVALTGFGSCYRLVHNGFTIDHLFKYELPSRRMNRRKSFYGCYSYNILPGEEMPKFFLLNEDGYVFFMASKELFNKLIELALCIIFQAKNGEYQQVLIEFFVDGKMVKMIDRFLNPADSDNIWIELVRPSEVWPGNCFGPNNWSRLGVVIRPGDGLIVKKCGFRLPCMPLENDLKVFLESNRLLEPGLLYEVWHEDGQMSTEEESSEEESSGEIKDLLDGQMNTEEDSSSNLDHNGWSVADFSIEESRYSLFDEYRVFLPGGEIPEKFVLVEDSTISFMASEDLYDKLLGLIFCVVFGIEDGEEEISFNIVPTINGQRQNVVSGTLGPFESDCTWIQLLYPHVLWGEFGGRVDFDQFDERYLRFSLRLAVSGGIVKRVGYLLRYQQLGDDLKVVLEDNPLVDLASFYEDSYDIKWEWESLKRLCP